MAHFNYNVLPTSRSEALSQIIGIEENGHIHCMYQPFSNLEKPQQSILRHSSNKQLKCKSCPGYYSSVSHIVQPSEGELLWVCIFCNAHNIWKGQYNSLRDIPSAYTMKLGTDEGIQEEETTIFIIDTICPDDELDSLKLALKNVVSTLNGGRYALISLSASGDVTIHSPESSKKDLILSITNSKIDNNLKKLNKHYFAKHISSGINTIWFKTTDKLDYIIKGLQAKDDYSAQKRPKRATGLSFFLAIILRDIEQTKNCHVLSFLSGPCTKGSGKVISRNKKSHMRQQHNLDTGDAKYFNEAKRFYDSLAKNTRLTFEIFVSSLDQIGLLEMSKLFESSAAIQQFDSFSDPRFDASLDSYIELRNSCAIYDVQITVISSPSLLVDGAIVHMIRQDHVPVADELKINYSDTPRGISSTNRWIVSPPCTLDPYSLAIPFSFSPSTEPTKSTAQASMPEQVFIQFQLRYTKSHVDHLQIITNILPTTNNSQFSSEKSIAEAFDVRIEISFLMRELCFQIMKHSRFTTKESKQMLYNLDKLALKYYKTLPNPAEILRYIYLLRKTPLLLSRSASPDERIIFLHGVTNSNIEGSLLYCRPEAFQFKCGLKLPIELTQERLNDPSTILVDGGYFVGVRYTNVDQDTKRSREHASQILNSPTRFPKPLYIDTRIGGSLDRYLKSKLIPINGAGTHQLNTQDMSLDRFIEVIAKLSLDP